MCFVVQLLLGIVKNLKPLYFTAASVTVTIDCYTIFGRLVSKCQCVFALSMSLNRDYQKPEC